MTSLDLIAAVALTACSAVLIGGPTGYPSDAPASRARLALSLSAWFLLIVAAGATGVFDYRRGIGTPGLGIAVLLPILALVLAARQGGLRSALQATPIELLIGLHAVRLLGVFFVLLYADNRLPAPFATDAGWGDIAIGATALPLAWLVRRRVPAWRGLAMAWNSLGTLDLVTAIALGVTSAEGSPLQLFHTDPSTLAMSELPWVLIPAFLVPLLFALHIAVYVRLAATRPAARLLPA